MRADGPRNLHLAARQLALPVAAQLLVAQRDGVQFFADLLVLLVQRHDFAELLADLGLPLHIGRAAFFHIAQIDKVIEFFFAALQPLGDFDDQQLHQGRPADRLLHAELAALHAPRQIDFAFAGQQRNGAHLAQIHAYRVVRVDRLFAC